ncbi:MAG: hypothetical protein AB1705_26865, partial [Verrucomicrobiota bacterium]
MRMHIGASLLSAWLIIFGAPAGRVWAAEFKAKVVDGAGRPLANAILDVELTERGVDGKIIHVQRLKLVSDQRGLVKGTYEEKKISTEDIRVYISKAGYENYSTGLGDEYILKRSFGPRDVRRIARLSGEAQKAELKELLVGDYESQRKEEDLFELTFLYYPELRSALLALLADPTARGNATQLLSFVAVPDDLRLVIQHAAAPSKDGLFANRWAYAVVSALLDPVMEEEWAFLKKCALGEYDDRWVDSGAIRSLRLMASPRSREILDEVGRKNL